MVDSPAPGGPEGQPRPPLRTDAEGRKRSDWSRALRDAAPYLGIGTSFAASVLLGVGGGYWLDKKLGMSPWLLLVGSALGLFAGFYQFVKTVARKPK